MNSSYNNKPLNINITKKDAWQIVLQAKNQHSNKKEQKSYTIKCITRGHELTCVFSTIKNKLIKKNFYCEEYIENLICIYLRLIFVNDGPYFIGHLAQSLDGFIATKTGESKYISSRENLEHVHMLRCISDVIIVGSNTVRKDNPKLTVRLVKGDNPMRLILDKNNELHNKFNVFSNKDGLGFKVISSTIKNNDDHIFTLPLHNGYFKIDDLASLLKKLNKKIIFVEGGGSLLSKFFDSGYLNQLQICMCPIILGTGKNSFLLNIQDDIPKLNYRHVKYLRMGNDILCDITF